MQRESYIVSFSDKAKKERGSSAAPGTTGRPAEILRARGSVRVSASQQFQAKGFYLSGFVSLVLAGSEVHGDEAMVLVASLSTVVGDLGS